MFLEVDQLRADLLGIEAHVSLPGYCTEVVPLLRNDHVHPVRVDDQAREGFSVRQYGSQILYPDSHLLKAQPLLS